MNNQEMQEKYDALDSADTPLDDVLGRMIKRSNRLPKDIKLSRQQSRLYTALCCGHKVDSLSCGERLGISGSGLHSRLFELKDKGLDIKSKRAYTKFNTPYKAYYL